MCINKRISGVLAVIPAKPQRASKAKIFSYCSLLYSALACL